MSMHTPSGPSYFTSKYWLPIGTSGRRPAPISSSLRYVACGSSTMKPKWWTPRSTLVGSSLDLMRSTAKLMSPSDRYTPLGDLPTSSRPKTSLYQAAVFSGSSVEMATWRILAIRSPFPGARPGPWRGQQPCQLIGGAIIASASRGDQRRCLGPKRGAAPGGTGAATREEREGWLTHSHLLLTVLSLRAGLLARGDLAHTPAVN